MKNRILALTVLAAMLLTLLCACGEKSSFLTAEEAQKIAVEASGFTDNQISAVHNHPTTSQDGKPCYSIHITVAGVNHEFVIDAATGEVLSTGTAHE